MNPVSILLNLVILAAIAFAVVAGIELAKRVFLGEPR